MMDAVDDLLNEMEVIGAEALRLVELTPLANDPFGGMPSAPQPDKRKKCLTTKGPVVLKLKEAAVLAARLSKLLEEIAGDTEAPEMAMEDASVATEEAPESKERRTAKALMPKLYAGTRERLRAREPEARTRMGTEVIYDEDRGEAPMATPDGILAVVQSTPAGDMDPSEVPPPEVPENGNGGARDLFGPDFDVDFDVGLS